ncbi:MAG TPA: hypothetical protein VGI39_05130 [Polyangiaceae bacterium]|jgi:hypothetical protein
MMPELPRERPILVPEEGPANPLFAALGSGDIVEVTILFHRPLGDAALDVAEQAVLEWFERADWGGPAPTLVKETLTAECLHVAVTGVRTARLALEQLLGGLSLAGVPVGRAVFACLRADGDRDSVVRGMDPEARPQMEYDDPRDWWRACFDPSAPPPISEDRVELAHDDDALLEVGDTTYAERRGLPLHVPDVRICYGLGEASFDDDQGSLRGREVADVFRTALAARFGVEAGARRPQHYDRRLQRDAPLDRVRAGDRTGYSCAFHAGDLREFLHDHLFRYREYELMLALRDTVRALDLEPVICWRRSGGRYVVQIWERSASLIDAAA